MSRLTNAKMHNNNEIEVTGLLANLEFSHKWSNKVFYKAIINIPRMSGTIDTLNLIIPEPLIQTDISYENQLVHVMGSVRSYNRNIDYRNNAYHSKLVLVIYAHSMNLLHECQNHTNSVCFDGYVCKPPCYRETPLGKKITDILIAVNRNTGRTDYIPCICWGSNATYASTLNVGTHISCSGRFQSRKYRKCISETESEERTAYEVSIFHIENIGKE